MKKFTLVFVLFVLTISFMAMYFFFMVAKTIPQKQVNNEVSTEEKVEPEGGVNKYLGPSIYEDYTKDLYDTSLGENRVIVLYFTANWCPICREQEPINKQVFDELDSEGVVGLRVHVLDSETTDETNALAQKFDVVYQHTFVILDTKGAVFYKIAEEMKEEELTKHIKEAGEVF